MAASAHPLPREALRGRQEHVSLGRSKRHRAPGTELMSRSTKCARYCLRRPARVPHAGFPVLPLLPLPMSVAEAHVSAVVVQKGDATRRVAIDHHGVAVGGPPATGSAPARASGEPRAGVDAGAGHGSRCVTARRSRHSGTCRCWASSTSPAHRRRQRSCRHCAGSTRPASSCRPGSSGPLRGCSGP